MRPLVMVRGGVPLAGPFASSQPAPNPSVGRAFRHLSPMTVCVSPHIHSTSARLIRDSRARSRGGQS